MLWLFLCLIPLSLVTLDAYGWLFPKKQASDFPLQGLMPISVPAQTSQSLSLAILQAAGADYQIAIKGPETELLIPAQVTKSDPLQPQRWQSHLPPLATGTYQLRLQPTQAKSRLPVRDLTLQVQPQRLWQAQLGAHKLPAASQIPLTLSAAEAGQVQVKLVGAQADLPQWRFSHQPPLSAPSLQLPADLPAGEYQLDLTFQAQNQAQAKTATQKLKFQLVQNQAAAGFQVLPASQLLLKNQAQKLQLWVMNANQQPLASGWVRVLAKNWPVKDGQAEVHLQAKQIASRIPYTLGDAQGNLFQGELKMQVHAGDWLIQLNQQGQPYLLASKTLGLHYFSQSPDNQAAVIGRLDVKAGENALTDVGKNTPEALYVVDANGQQQSLLWPRPDRFGASASPALTVNPIKPNALQALQVSLKAPLASGTAGERSAMLLQAYKKTGLSPHLLQAPQASYHLIGFPEAQAAPAWATFFWLLFALVLIAAPWIYLHKKLLAWVALHRRPFPNPKHIAALDLGRWAAFSMSLSGCLLLLLSWLLPVALWSAFAVVLLGSTLAVCSFAYLRLRQVLPAQSYCFPVIQFFYFCWCLWFVFAYAPAMISAVSLAIALAGFGWLASFVFLRGKELSQNRSPLLALATLTVLALLQAGIAWVRPSASSGTVQAELSESLPALTEWQPQAQLLYQSRQASTQKLSLPALQESGEIQVLTQHYSLPAHAVVPTISEPAQALITIRPAVLARLSAPAVAVLGDQLEIPLTVVNPLTTAQSVPLRLTPGKSETLELAARTQQSLLAPFVMARPGLNLLTLAHRFEQNWLTQESKIFAMQIEPAQQNRDLRLQVRVPQAENLVPGEEIPVLVRFQHHLRGEQQLGLQIGLPAGFSVLTDTLQDSANTDWLAGFEQNAAYLNLRTQALKPGRELSFHFRLRAGLQGQMKMPPSRLLVLDQPTLKTVLEPIQLSVKALN